MKKYNKWLLIIICLIFILVLVSIAIRFFFYPSRNVYNIFDQPNVKTDVRFPASNPQFMAEIATVKTRSINQQSIKIYKISDNKKAAIFQRFFYDDAFHGNNLVYTIYPDSASFLQNGILTSFGCEKNNCALEWSNFYKWDNKHNTFVLDNISHKYTFKQLLTTYQGIDNQGCSIIGNDIVPNQKGFSFTQLYKKFPNFTSYCSNNQQLIKSSQILYFLKIEKTLQDIIDGKNLGSRDIKDNLK